MLTTNILLAEKYDLRPAPHSRAHHRAPPRLADPRAHHPGRGRRTHVGTRRLAGRPVLRHPLRDHPAHAPDRLARGHG